MVRLEDHRHPPAFHLRVALDLAHQPERILDLFEDIAAQLQVSHLAAAELQRELHLVPFLQELAGVVDLDHQVVIADLDRLELQFFELTAAVGSAGLVFLLLLLIAPLAVVHDLTDRRAGVGGDFHQVKPKFAGAPKGFGGGSGTDFIVVLVDQKNR